MAGAEEPAGADVGRLVVRAAGEELRACSRLDHDAPHRTGALRHPDAIVAVSMTSVTLHSFQLPLDAAICNKWHTSDENGRDRAARVIL